MVCAKCEKKLSSKPSAADPFRNRNAQGTLVASGSKAGPSRGAGASVATSGPSRGTPGSTNKLLGAKNRYNPTSLRCKLCGSTPQQERATYCQSCASKKGICAICGKMMMDTKMYKMSST